MNTEKLPLVFAGHVDHGKSTIIGRLLIETGNLPDGKLEAIRSYCKINSRPFEYAFLIDALKDEQSQGITIDTARVFFSAGKRDFVIIDAPGHIEFLKNMVTGASRADAAFLVIAADEGVCENSRRHGFMLSMLGIKQVVVIINKMDRVSYSESCFDSIKEEYEQFLSEIGIPPMGFVPASGTEGVNIYRNSEMTPWYDGKTVYEFLESFRMKNLGKDLPFRMFVQDIYHFTKMNDNRRIYAGTVNSGTISVNEAVTFYPSGKKSHISAIESFSTEEKSSTSAGYTTGFTLNEQIYTTRGELVVRGDETPPSVSKCFKAAVFWLGDKPLEKNREYKIKLGTSTATLKLVQIIKLMNTSTLEGKQGNSIGRHEAAECVLEAGRPLAFDPIHINQETGRFVIVSDYEIRGGGIILEKVSEEHCNNNKDAVSAKEREIRYGHKSALLIIKKENGKNSEFAENLERYLFENGKFVYRIGETGHDTAAVRHFINAGMIVIVETEQVDDSMLNELGSLFDSLYIKVIENVDSENSMPEVMDILKQDGIL